MVRYFYAWLPAVVLFGTVTVMTIPYLAVIVLLAVLLAVVTALGALVWATVSALYRLARSAVGRTVPRTSQERADASPRVPLPRRRRLRRTRWQHARRRRAQAGRRRARASARASRHQMIS